MPNDQKRSKKTRRIVIVLVKLAIAAALLVVLLSQTKWADLRKAFQNIRWAWFVLAVLLHFPGYLISAWRWRLLLVAQGQPIPFWKLVESYLVATFFNYTLLGTLGGDVVRMTDTGLGRKRGAQASSAVFVERLTGLVAMVFLAALGLLLLAVSGAASSQMSGLALGALGLFAVVCVGLVVLTQPAVVRRLAAFAAKLAPGARALEHRSALVRRPAAFAARVVQAIGTVGHKLAEALDVFRADRRPVYMNLAWAFLLQINVAAHYFCLALAMGLPPIHKAPLPYALNYMVLVPLITLILMIPITPGGAGVRELTLKELRRGLGFAAARAGATRAYLLGWLQVASVLIYGAAGLVIFISRSLRARGAEKT